MKDTSIEGVTRAVNTALSEPKDTVDNLRSASKAIRAAPLGELESIMGKSEDVDVQT